jgi:hypothetical protein
MNVVKMIRTKQWTQIKTKRTGSIHSESQTKTILENFENCRKKKVLDFFMGMSHICTNDEYRCQVGPANRSENIVIRIFARKVVDVLSFHLQIFHWYIAPPSHRYFQSHSP